MASPTVKENSISRRVPGKIHAFNYLNIITQTTCDAKWLLKVSIGCTQEPFMFWNFFLGTSTAFCQLPLFGIVTEVMAFLSLNKGLKLNDAPPEGTMMKLYLHVSTPRSVQCVLYCFRLDIFAPFPPFVSLFLSLLAAVTSIRSSLSSLVTSEGGVVIRRGYVCPLSADLAFRPSAVYPPPQLWFLVRRPHKSRRLENCAFVLKAPPWLAKSSRPPHCPAQPLGREWSGSLSLAPTRGDRTRPLCPPHGWMHHHYCT